LIISPEDLLQAVSYMPALRLGGISQRLFPSGLTVLQDDAVDDASSAAGLVVAANTQEASGIARDDGRSSRQVFETLGRLGARTTIGGRANRSAGPGRNVGESPVHFQSISRVCRRATLRLELILVCK
jgi:hypothetical protein